MDVLCHKRELRSRYIGGAQVPVLVPTMGALHAGHEALIRHAASLAAGGEVVVSIFVNPTQFNDAADFAAYPQTLEDDLALCERAGAGCVFVPEAGSMYAGDASTRVTESSLSPLWEGSSRPDHFDGVCTVVTKLFNLIGGRGRAVFGEKDWQQLAIVRRLVRDLDLEIELHPHPVVREDDGLALSSRNRRLGAEARRAAPGIHRALRAMAEESAVGASVGEVEFTGRRALREVDGLETDYLAIIDEDSLAIRGADAEARRAGTRAIFAGLLDGIRLLDNHSLAD